MADLPTQSPTPLFLKRNPAFNRFIIAKNSSNSASSAVTPPLECSFSVLNFLPDVLPSPLTSDRFFFIFSIEFYLTTMRMICNMFSEGLRNNSSCYNRQDGDVIHVPS
ncbi:hypothetical protein HanRHA438_Chr17g0838261 [Helianthus annuus]|nr:hypothetical protein HanHA300_Chr17g0674161 [Helianthus annuus]KAJ0449338.1 hypothetical protein HanHA89_Chr17g0727361 [Helianthus annuus]KAJ0828528.1 hypothetical protein HanRHA438_Chr17g0838261 [Helianthus annuus]